MNVPPSQNAIRLEELATVVGLTNEGRLGDAGADAQLPSPLGRHEEVPLYQGWEETSGPCAVNM